MLEPGLLDERQIFMDVKYDAIQRRGLWFSLFVVLELFLLALPGVSREHTQEVIVKGRGEVAWLGDCSPEQGVK